MDIHDEFLGEHFPDGTERALAGAILAYPDAALPKLIYADWLDERDDPRGEYVRLIAEAEVAPERAAVLRRGCAPGWLSVMGHHRTVFGELAKRGADSDEIARGYRPHITPTFDRGLWDIHYSAGLFGDSFSFFTLLISDRLISPVVRSIRMDGHEDRGRSNGTLHLNISPLVADGVRFPYLQHFETERDPAGTWQGITIDRGYEYQDTGELAALLANSPRLKTLIVPSTPNPDFFNGPTHSLESLDVYCTFTRQRFIPNLTQCKRFPNLKVLRFRDNCDAGNGCQDGYTTFAEFAEFLSSPNTAHIETLELHDVMLPKADITRLRKIRSDGVRITRSQYA